MTLGEARTAIRTQAPSIAFRKTEYGEYRVNFRGGREATAYYTNDLADAVATAIIMHKHGDCK